jgi:hypothetical protein
MEVLPWETLNLIDGRRSASEIADILTAEFSTTLETAWVERMIGILQRRQLVAR